jgi:methylglutaconyl-CoA hydratase
MGYDTIRLDVDGRGVATLRFMSPAKHNVLSAQAIQEISSACAELSARTDLRAVILAADGPSFCAGGDLGWMREQMAADRATRMREATKLAMMLNALNTLPQPLIGRVQGNAFGGGVGMMSVCDVAIGVEGAKFGLTEVKLGIIPATISPYLIARMGEAKARRVFFSGRLFGAEEAQELGLLARVVTLENLDAAIEAEVLPYLAAAPGAVARSKALVRSLGPRIDEAVIAQTIGHLADAWEQDEAREGISAFFEKREPTWLVK